MSTLSQLQYPQRGCHMLNKQANKQKDPALKVWQDIVVTMDIKVTDRCNKTTIEGVSHLFSPSILLSINSIIVAQGWERLIISRKVGLGAIVTTVFAANNFLLTLQVVPVLCDWALTFPAMAVATEKLHSGLGVWQFESSFPSLSYLYSCLCHIKWCRAHF